MPRYSTEKRNRMHLSKKRNRFFKVLTLIFSVLLIAILARDYYNQKNKADEIRQMSSEEVINSIATINSEPTIVAFGDSIMAGDGNNAVGIADIIGKSHDMKVYDYSIGGAIIAWNDDLNNASDEILRKQNIQYQISCAIETLDYAPNFILIDGGTNDICSNIPIGSITTDINMIDKTTFAGGLEYCIKQLKDAYPSTKIIYIRCHNMGSRSSELQITIGDIEKEICKKWDINFVDVYSDTEFNTNSDEYLKYTNKTETQPNGDMTHPTQEGYEKYYIPLIEKVLE